MLSKALPGLRLLASYRGDWLRGDVVAGVTLAAYLLPAGHRRRVARGPAARGGLYACLFAGLVFWLFCSSRHTADHRDLGDLAAGRTSLGGPRRRRPARYAALASATALIVAALGFVAWLMRAGEPRELHLRDGACRVQDRRGPAPRQHAAPEALRLQGSHGDFWERMGHFLAHLGETNPRSLALGAAALGLLILGKRFCRTARCRSLVLVAGIVGRGRCSGSRTAAWRCSARCRRACPRPACRRSPLATSTAAAARDGVLPARRRRDRRDRPDVRPQARLPARQQSGVPRARRRPTSPPASATASR